MRRYTVYNECQAKGLSTCQTIPWIRGDVERTQPLQTTPLHAQDGQWLVWGRAQGHGYDPAKGVDKHSALQTRPGEGDFWESYFSQRGLPGGEVRAIVGLPIHLQMK